MYSASLEGRTINPTFMLPLAGCENEFAVADDKRICVIRWDGCSPNATLVRNMTVIEQYATTHIEIGGIDPKGRFLAGTYREIGCVKSSDPSATVYLVRKDGEIVPIIQNLDTSAGCAWNKKKNLFYFFDSCTYTIYEYCWSPQTGNISEKQIVLYQKRKLFFNIFLENPRPVYNFDPNQTYVPLGMDINCRGNLFVALYPISEVVEINPR